MPSTKPTLPGRRSTVLCSAWSCTAPSRRTSPPHWGSATGNFMRWPTRLEILLARGRWGAPDRRRCQSFGSGTLSIIGSATGTLIVIIGCRVTRWFAPGLRVDARNQAGCCYEGGRTVKPAPLRYSRPGSTAEALALLASLGEDGKVLAGGQSLVPLLSMRLAAPEHLVDINRLAELGYVRVEDGQVRVGALARHAQVLADPAAAAAQPLLAKALRFVAHAAIRNRGTTVGSIVHADPAGEMPAVLAVLDGAVRVAHQGGERLVPARRVLPRAAGVGGGAGGARHRGPVPGAAAGRGHRVRRGEQAARRLRGVRGGRHRPARTRTAGSPRRGPATCRSGRPRSSSTSPKRPRPTARTASPPPRTWPASRSTPNPTSTPPPTTGGTWPGS